MIDNLTV